MSDTPNHEISSQLTDAQVECLTLYRKIKSGQLTLKHASSTRLTLRGQPTTEGAFLGIVQQGRNNIKKAVATIVLGVWLGYIELEDLRRLSDMISKLERGNVDQFHLVSPVVNQLIDRMVL